jgi:serine/threonine protein kinase
LTNSILPHHVNVLRFITILESPYCLISEYCEGGSLFDWMMRNDYDEHGFIQFALGIAKGKIDFFFIKKEKKGMSHLHRNNVIHRDLATRNVLVRVKEKNSNKL